MSSEGAGYSPARLFAVSFAALFLEMAAIRWLNATIEVVAYFTNLVLLACFFGLGVGCLLAGRIQARLIRLAPAGLLVFVLAVELLGEGSIQVSYHDDVIFAPTTGFYERALLSVPVAALGAFLAVTMLFALLGHELGRQMGAARDPVRGYVVDIAGSLAGTVAYALLAWAGAPPHVWFGLGVCLLLPFQARRWSLAASVLLAVGAVVLVRGSYEQARWSPYYKVETLPYHDPANRELGRMILVDNVRIQDALRFGPELASSPLRGWIPYYDLPYHFVRPRRVLILGAGSGNEAWVAVQHGAERVVAVEIDPVLASFGRELHPMRPYTLPQVEVVVDDARAFLARCQEQFDLVVLSALDSHRQIPGLSSLRLESFVYTTGSYRSMSQRLAPGGLLCLNLSSTREWMGTRTYWSIAEAVRAPPRVYTSVESPFDSVAYLHGPPELFQRDLLPEAGAVRPVDPPPGPHGVTLCSDDWPFLYLRGPAIPELLQAVLVLLLLLSGGIVAAVAPEARRPRLHFFCLGAAFMLLETRSVTQVALLYGATWSVTALVFSAVLAAILLTNLLILRDRAPSHRTSYVLLLATLAGLVWFPFASLLALPEPLRALAVAVAVGAPIAWASFVFSASLRLESRVAAALGSNLLGVVVGGALEYLSNVFGLRALYGLALLLYVLSLLVIPRGEAARVS